MKKLIFICILNLLSLNIYCSEFLVDIKNEKNENLIIKVYSQEELNELKNEVNSLPSFKIENIFKLNTTKSLNLNSGTQGGST